MFGKVRNLFAAHCRGWAVGLTGLGDEVLLLIARDWDVGVGDSIGGGVAVAIAGGRLSWEMLPVVL